MGNLIKRVIVIINVFAIVIILASSFFYLKHSNKKVKHYNSGNFANGLGVNIHFTGDPKDIQLIRRSGLKIVRMDLLWSSVEKRKRSYEFKSTGYDQLTESLIENGIRPYYVLDFSNILYEPNTSITSEKGIRAFERFVAKATSRYGGKHIIWEIWNEPDGNFWNPKPNYDAYVNLVKNTSKVIRKNDPTGTIVAPALSSLNNDSLYWLNEVFKRGILNYIDALSVHPYRNEAPESVSKDYSYLRKLISSYTNRSVQIFSGEWGYSNGKGIHGNVNDITQAQYLVRMYLINTMNGIPISIWYDWKNDGVDPNNIEDNFGIRENDVLIPKLGYYALETLIRELRDFKFKYRVNMDSDSDYVLIFRNRDGEEKIVCWTTGATHSITLSNITSSEVVSMYGEKIGTLNKDYTKVKISHNPVYVSLNKDSGN